MEKLNACIEALKSSARTGWMQRGVPPGMAENIASHSFEVAIISLIIAEKAKEYGIEVEYLSEFYTSGVDSSVDGIVCKENYTPEARIERGLYKTKLLGFL
ncbi:MAG: HD domain-containing protein, partial [Fervidicoccaceae archaeon]